MKFSCSWPEENKPGDVYKLDVHGSVYYNINLTEITNKMRACSRNYYSNVS
jgi:hypothetical protein